MNGDTSFKTKLYISSLLSCLKREKEAYKITKLFVCFQLLSCWSILYQI